MLKLHILLLISIFLGSCQQAPTKVYSDYRGDFASLVKGTKAPLVLDENSIVIDARRRFDYTMLHIPGSTLLNWEEFTDHRSALPGLLQEDYSRMVRRLGRLGIQPDSKIIVVGKGLNGKGEEGRLAWTLFYLGVKDVQVADINLFKRHLRQDKVKPRQPVPYWKPQLKKHIRIRKNELLSLNQSSQTKNVRIIDVRSAKEYLKQSANSYGLPEIQAINIQWQEFFTSQGRPQVNIASKITAIGVKKSDTIIVVSQKGIRSAAVTMALLSIGFLDVRNYDGGLAELLRR